MVVALPAILVLAGLVFAYGIIMFGQAFTDALFGILNGVLKYSGAGLVFKGGNWLLKKVGAGVDDPVNRAHQWISEKLGAAADGVGGAVAATWNRLATIVDRTGWAIWHTALAVERLYSFVTDYPRLAKLLIKTSPFVLAFRWLRDHLDTVTNVTNVINKSIVHPVQSTVGTAIHVVTRPTTVGLDRLRAWTTAQIKILRQSIAHAGAQALPLPGTAVADLRDALNRLRKRVARIDTKGLAYIGSGVFVATLARFGLNWIRCQNVKRFGRGICRADTDFLDTVLQDGLAIVGTLSIVGMANALLEVEDEVVAAIMRNVRETAQV